MILFRMGELDEAIGSVRARGKKSHDKVVLIHFSNKAVRGYRTTTTMMTMICCSDYERLLFTTFFLKGAKLQEAEDSGVDRVNVIDVRLSHRKMYGPEPLSRIPIMTVVSRKVCTSSQYTGCI